MRVHRRTKKRCAKHHGIGHFSRTIEGGSARLWRCSVCGHEGPWTDDFSYFGMMSCIWCGCEPAIEVVTCSDKCRSTPALADAERGEP